MTERNRVLIIGGTGFLGAYTASELVERDNSVVLYDKSSNTDILRKLDIDDEVRIITGDVTEFTSVFKILRREKITHIIHLASLLTPQVRSNPRSAAKVNIMGTNNIFEAAGMLDDHIERVVWASSAAVYASASNYNDYVDEDDLLLPSTLYGATKEYNEHQARLYSEKNSVSYVGIRPTIVYGPHRRAGSTSFLMDLIEKPAVGESVTVGYGDQALNWQYIKDVARGFRQATFTPAEDLSQRVYNIAGNIATVSEVADLVQEIIPSADITVSNDGELPWMEKINADLAEHDFGYETKYDLRSGIRDYIDSHRDEQNMSKK